MSANSRTEFGRAGHGLIAVAVRQSGRNLNALSGDERDALMQKRLRDAVAALSARWESMPTEGLHELMRSFLARTQVYSDRVDLEVDPAALVRLLLNESGGEEIGIGGRASTPAADRAETHSIMLIIPARQANRYGDEIRR